MPAIINWRPIIKDTSHSCIFEFPDGPPPPVAPPPVPSDPPGCYPYCQSSDWPPVPYPPPPPGPVIIPPEADPVDELLSLLYISSSCIIQDGHVSDVIHYRLRLSITGIAEINSEEIGTSSGTFLGGSATEFDYAIAVYRGLETDTIIINPVNFLDFAGNPTENIRIRFIAELDTDDGNLNTAAQNSLYPNVFNGIAADEMGDPIVFHENIPFAFGPPPGSAHYVYEITWDLYYAPSAGLVYAMPLAILEGDYFPPP